ncbi:MAG: hypothetical protein MJY82_02020 [Fibrobacter sp.]|nr:hypothetical protein [Fibrobacter sp.]
MADFGKYVSKASEKLNPVRRITTSAKGHSRVSMNKLMVMVTIVNRRKADFYMDYIQSFGVNMQILCFGKGTAPQEIVMALGLIDSDRAIIFSVIGEDNAKLALEGLEEKFLTIPGGRGVAYTVPMASVIGKSIFNFLSDNRNQVRRNEK